MNTKSPAFIALLLCLALTPAAAEETDTPAAPEYTGTWIRNDDLSDDPAEILGRNGGARQEPGRNPGGAMRGGGMGRGGGKGRGGPSKGGGNDPSSGRRPPRMMQGLQRLEIFHEGDEFAVTDANDILQSLYTDGRRVERWTDRGQVFDMATISSTGIAVRSESEGGGRTATYALDTESGRLTVRHVFVPPGQKSRVSLKMVYERK